MSTIVNIRQGSKEWHQHRTSHYNASDAASMLGISPYKSRSDLLKEKAMGLTSEIDPETQRRFDNGHEYEAVARPWAEEIIGSELYPVVLADEIDGLPLGASFDGLTIDDEIAFEHKTLSANLAAALDQGVIPDEYHPQMEQQLLLSGASKCLFMASNGDRETMRYAWYEPNPEVRKRLLAGWKQFNEDLANYQPEPVTPEAVGRAPEALPALLIEVTGMVKASNLTEFKAQALAVVQGINRDLQTDEDFANAEKTVKWCGDVEAKLDAAKQHALAQTADIDALFRAVDSIKAEFRATRLELEKLVKARKETIRGEILTNGNDAYQEHIAKLNESLGKALLSASIGTVPRADFASVMKGKKTVKSLRDAVDQELVRVKIASNEIAERVRANLKKLEELIGENPRHLIHDWRDLIFKDGEAMEAIVKNRINEHEQDEAKRLEQERERIRQEEQAKAEREAQAKLEAERKADEIARQKAAVEEADRRRIEASKQEAAENQRKHIEAKEAEEAERELIREEADTQQVDTAPPAGSGPGFPTLHQELEAWRRKQKINDAAYMALIAILTRHQALRSAA